MAMAVVTIASGGLPVIDVTATTPNLGVPVTEATRGIAVTKVTLPKGGLPVTFVVDSGGASVTTTMDPANKYSSINLSNGNLTATNANAADTDVSVKSTTTRNSGKVYVEVTAVAIGRASIGIGNAGAPVAMPVGGTGNFGIGSFNSAALWLYNYFATVGACSTYATSNVVMIAVDFDAALIWQRVAVGGVPGNWNASGPANPATGVGGVSYTGAGMGAGPYHFMLSPCNSATTLTVNFGATAFAQTPPAGFGTW